MTVTFISLTTKFEVSFQDITDSGCRRVTRSYVESLSIWPTGSKLRTRRYANVHEYYAYLNKLFQLRLLSRTEHEVAWNVGLRLEYDSLTADYAQVDSSKTVCQDSLTW